MSANLGTHTRYANDLSFFNKYDYQATDKDRLYLSLNLNRFRFAQWLHHLNGHFAVRS